MTNRPAQNQSLFKWFRDFPILKWLTGIVLIIFGVGIGWYLIYFNLVIDSHISRSTQDWGAFADYIALFFNIINAIAVIALTVVLYQEGNRREDESRKQQEKQEEADKLQRERREKENRDFQTLRDRENREHEAAYQTALETPIIVFQVHAEPIIQYGHAVNYHFYWIIKNAGKGPALNVLVKAEGCDGWENKAVKCYTILSRDTLRIPWIPSAYRIQARYNDIFNNVYTATTVDDDTFVTKDDLIGAIEPRNIVRFEDALKADLRIRGYL
jgi:uncharacterized membrane protein